MLTFNQLSQSGQKEALKYAKDKLFELLIEGVMEMDARGYNRKSIDFIAEAAAENALYRENNGTLEVIF